MITPSVASRAQVIAAYGCSPEHVYAVHHGVDHTVFKPAVSGGRELVGRPYVLFVGLYHPRKNYTAVRAAVTQLAAAGFPHVLAVVGNAPPDPGAERFAAEATSELPGFPGRIASFKRLPVHDLAELMAGADVFCLPSRFEGFGLPALEAMACGVPVVVSDCGALPEVVGDAGIITSIAAHEVTEAVHRVVSDPKLAGRLREASIRRAAQFSWADTARGWLRALESAA